MNKESLIQLEKLNKILLSEEEREEMLCFFEKQSENVSGLDAIPTQDVERMVHVMPMTNVIRDDVAIKQFTRDQLQEDAPESYDGYWQVPRLVE
ncbi:MAG: Asp-tRNA(Asn)/Glu-tRNA(Gln) amidotransferase subunit GatC [Lachnospiraceae bacterium]|nr:Asp-tRNA(Asn)/Glu-tRNA(Gln) amidotransferase subunit GatC [Lachnospiraceae bacterium]